MKAAILLSSGMALVGCMEVGAPALNPATIQQLPTAKICAAIYATTRTPAKFGSPVYLATRETNRLRRNELIRRKAFTPIEVVMLSGGMADAGMREEVAVCAWGGSYQRVNTTRTASGYRHQLVFGDGRYIYSENGIVTAVQY